VHVKLAYRIHPITYARRRYRSPLSDWPSTSAYTHPGLLDSTKASYNTDTRRWLLPCDWSTQAQPTGRSGGVGSLTGAADRRARVTERVGRRRRGRGTPTSSHWNPASLAHRRHRSCSSIERRDDDNDDDDDCSVSTPSPPRSSSSSSRPSAPRRRRYPPDRLQQTIINKCFKHFLTAS